MLLVVFGFLIVALIDFVPIVRRRSWRTMIAFLVMYIPGLTLSVLLAMKVQIPSVMKIIGDAFKSIGLSY